MTEQEVILNMATKIRAQFEAAGWRCLAFDQSERNFSVRMFVKIGKYARLVRVAGFYVSKRERAQKPWLIEVIRCRRPTPRWVGRALVDQAIERLSRSARSQAARKAAGVNS